MMSLRSSHLAASFVAAALLVVAQNASAQSVAPVPPQPPPYTAAPAFAAVTDATVAQELALMDRQLAVFADEAKTARTTAVIAATTGALVLGPTGYFLSQRSGDPVAHAAGPGMLIGSAVTLGAVALSLGASPIEKLHHSFEQRRVSGLTSKQVLDLTEADWQTAAMAANRTRHVRGGIEVAFGAATTAAGVFFFLDKPTAGMDRVDQSARAGQLVGGGVPLLAFGLRSLIQPSVEELSWDSYRTTKTIFEPASNSPTFHFSAAPTLGGAMGLATITF